jgi:hypothetical protein
MLRKLAVLTVFLVVALAPFGTSAQGSSMFWVEANGEPSTNLYFEGSGGCSTDPGSMTNMSTTYMFRGGPSFSASGLNLTSGSVFEEFVAVGTEASGKAYFFNENTDEAFEFWFQGMLSCPTEDTASVNATWSDGFMYSTDPATGELLCTELSGSGYVFVDVDFQQQTTETTIYGAFGAEETVPCSTV